MFCQNCGNNIPEGSKFCDGCGLPVTPDPSEQQQADAAAGADTAQAAPEAPAPSFQEQTPVAREFIEPAFVAGDVPKKKKSKAGLLVGISVGALLLVALIVVGIMFVPRLFSSPTGSNHILYFSDNSMSFLKDVKDKKPVTVSDKIASSKSDINVSNAYWAMYLVRFTDDYLKVYFPTRMEDYSDFTLNVAELKNMKPGVDNEKFITKVSSGVSSYTLLDTKKGTIVYLKDAGSSSGGDLYYFNLTDSVKIDSSVSTYWASKSGHRLIYTKVSGDYEQALYIVDLTQKNFDPQKIDSNISWVQNYDDEFDAIYYTKYAYDSDEINRTTLYKAGFKNDREKILSDISYIIAASDSGKIYYAKDKEQKISLYDYVDDDMRTKDAAMKEPDPDDFLITEIFWGEEYITVDYDAYWDAWYDYYDKEERDYLREWLKESEFPMSLSEAYVYDEKTGSSSLLVENFSGTRYVDIDNELFIYSKYSMSTIKKLKMSDDIGYYDVAEAVYGSMTYSSTLYMKSKGSSEYEISGDIEDVYFDSATNTLYARYREDIEKEKDMGSLYSFTVEGGKLVDKKNIADQFDNMYILGGTLYYSVDVSDAGGDVYVYEKGLSSKVATDINELHMYDDGIKLLVSDIKYTNNYDMSKFTLTMLNKKGEKSRISDDVTSFVRMSDGQILFITDTNFKDGGTLYLYTAKGEKVRLASDVLAVKNLGQYADRFFLYEYTGPYGYGYEYGF